MLQIQRIKLLVYFNLLVDKANECPQNFLKIQSFLRRTSERSLEYKNKRRIYKERRNYTIVFRESHRNSTEQIHKFDRDPKRALIRSILTAVLHSPLYEQQLKMALIEAFDLLRRFR